MLRCPRWNLSNYAIDILDLGCPGETLGKKDVWRTRSRWGQNLHIPPQFKGYYFNATQQKLRTGSGEWQHKLRKKISLILLLTMKGAWPNTLQSLLTRKLQFWGLLPLEQFMSFRIHIYFLWAYCLWKSGFYAYKINDENYWAFITINLSYVVY